MKISRRLTVFTLLLLIVWSIVSCDRTRLYDTFTRIPDAAWHTDSLQQYRFEISNTSDNHNLYFNIRNDRNYGFSNLWLFVTIVPPEGANLTDTIQVILANPAGKWFGKGISGVYTSQVPYRTQVYFPVKGTYTIQIQHGMRPEILKGITEVGIRVEKARS
jgi:gliding motility-associated lipoprotein GldH